MTETVGRPIKRTLINPDLIAFSQKGEKKTTSTYTSYSRNLESFLEKNHLTLETLKPLHAKAFIQEMGKYNQKTSSYEEMNTAASYKRFMRTLWNNLGRSEDAKILQHNLRDVASINKFKVDIPTSEIYKLIQYALDDMKCLYRLRFAFALSAMAFDGLRPAEALGLYYEDVDIPNKKLILVRHPNERYFPKATKVTDPAVSIPICDFTLELFLSIAPSETDKHIIPISYETLRTRFENYITRAGIVDREGNKITPHKMRHVFGHLWRNNKGDLQILKEIMRHSDIRITMLYSAPTDTEITTEFERTINSNIHA